MADTYRTVQGDTWDIVSKNVYGSEKYVDGLISANGQYRLVMFFPAGVVLNVPQVTTQEKASQNLPPWKRNA